MTNTQPEGDPPREHEPMPTGEDFLKAYYTPDLLCDPDWG